MIFKMLKYIRSLKRICILKIIYGNKLKFQFSGLKSLYIGKGVKIEITKQNKLILGKNVYIDDYCNIKCENGDIVVGDNTYFNSNNKIVALKKIEIGSNCLFGPNVGVYDHNHKYDYSEIPINSQGYRLKKINVGDNVWIGCNCTITAGVNICNNVVIGANSLINKDVKKIGIYGGIPIKLIKSIE